ncbi:MAG: hypothetical protein FWD03_00410, partial [Defluviitaleaceae bacterium]|nr:hypothetical protein [Defluviitaleaceae bacterium]
KTPCIINAKRFTYSIQHGCDHAVYGCSIYYFVLSSVYMLYSMDSHINGRWLDIASFSSIAD